MLLMSCMIQWDGGRFVVCLIFDPNGMLRRDRRARHPIQKKGGNFSSEEHGNVWEKQ